MNTIEELHQELLRLRRVELDGATEYMAAGNLSGAGIRSAFAQAYSDAAELAQQVTDTQARRGCYICTPDDTSASQDEGCDDCARDASGNAEVESLRRRVAELETVILPIVDESYELPPSVDGDGNALIAEDLIEALATAYHRPCNEAMDAAIEQEMRDHPERFEEFPISEEET